MVYCIYNLENNKFANSNRKETKEINLIRLSKYLYLNINQRPPIGVMIPETV